MANSKEMKNRRSLSKLSIHWMKLKNCRKSIQQPQLPNNKINNKAKSKLAKVNNQEESACVPKD